MTDTYPGDASAELLALADEVWTAAMESSPLYATAIGDRRFLETLAPNDAGALEREAARLRGFRDRASGIADERLAPADRVTRAALIDQIEHRLGHTESGIERWSVDPLDGPQVQFLNVASYQPLATEADGRAAVERWRAMGPWIDRQVERLSESADGGPVAPRALVASVVDELDDLLALPDDEWPLAGPASTVHVGWSAAASARFADDVSAAIRDGIRPAFERQRAFLVDVLRPLARPDERAGLSHVAGGADAYRHLVRAHTTLELEPGAIHATGLDEVARIDAEFEELGGRELGTASTAATLARLRDDAALRFATREEVRATAEAALRRATDTIGGWFGRLPQAGCEVVVMGDHESKHSTIAYYREPAGDGSRPGRYYINTTLPETRPRYEAEALAFHEAVPGHHLQIAIAQELTHLPVFRRFGGPTAYIEGWALYTERLCDEMGLYSGQLDHFGVLSFDAWRACRLVVDTGLHALGWSRQRAIDFMLEHTALAENNIVNEVDRYLALPAQALAYKLGQLEFLRLRAEATSTLGDAFDIRSFHDSVLGEGAVGLATLGRVVETLDLVGRGPIHGVGGAGGLTMADPGAASTSRPLVALRDVLGNAGIRRIEIAWTCGIAGDAAMLVALLVVAFQAGGPLAVGVLGVARTAPAIITGPIAGVLATRAHATRLLLLAHTVRAAATVGLTAWVALGWGLGGVFALVAVAALAGSLVRPLQIAAMPSLARDPGELVAANVVMSTGEGVGAFLGPLAAGLVVALSGPALAVALAAIVFAAGALALLGLRPTGDVAAELAAQARTAAPARRVGALRALGASLAAGPGALLPLPGAAVVIVDFDAQVLVRGLSTTLAVVASFELLGMGDAGVGLLAAAFGLGSLAGAIGAVGLAGRRRIGPIFAVALSMWGLPLAVIGAAPLAPVALAALLASGVANGILDVAGFTLLQRSVPNAARVPVFGFFEATLGIGAAAGAILAPLLIVPFGTTGALGITGAILPILAVATWPRLNHVDEEAMIPDREVRLLRGIPLFAPLPMTALERIAGALSPTAYAADETIFREGDPGDRYLIIAEGEVEISQNGRAINRCRAGEGIGEIALLQSVPRTATVTAITATRGYELGAGDFLAAIAGPTSMAAASLVAEERLARSA